MKFTKKHLSAVIAATICTSVFCTSPAFAETEETETYGTAVEVEEEGYILPRYPEGYHVHQGEAVPTIDEELLGASSTESYHSIYYDRLMGDYSPLTDSQKAAVEAKADEIIAGMDPDWNDIQKVIYLNDYITTHMAYDNGLSDRDLYSGIVLGSGVCEGYAKTFWYLAYKAGINSRLITSFELNHQWNLVEINGSWYHIDTTWNDPMSMSYEDVPGRAYHKYFLVSDSMMRTSDYGHDATDWIFYEEGGASASGYATSTLYNSGIFWSDIKIPIPICGDYFIQAENKWGSSAIYKINTSTLSKSTLLDMSDEIWYVVGNPYSYWTNTFIGVGAYNGRIYYNNSTALKSCNINGTDITTEYELDSAMLSQYNIYGMLAENGIIKLTLANDPNYLNQGITYSVKLTTDFDVPPAPTAEISVGTSKHTISWNSVAYADKYAIYRSDSTIGAKRLIGTTSSTNFTDTDIDNSETYNYYVAGYNSTDNVHGEYSAAASNEIKKASVVTAPTGKSLTYSGYAMTLINAGTASNGTLMYSLDGINYSSSLPKGTEVKKYTIYYYVMGNSGYADSDIQTITAEINEKILKSVVFDESAGTVRATYTIGSKTIVEIIYPQYTKKELVEKMSISECSEFVNYVISEGTDPLILTEGQLYAIEKVLADDYS
ncbi:MAG: hypothetical protein IJ446_09585 [Oscillospiraceae bacterium]|nr:hypothetical protein [Oscillospiraceae bacterium]